MKTQKKWYFVIVLAITFLIYDQNWGLNALVISILTGIYLFIFNNDIIIISFRRVSLNSAMFYNLMWGQLWGQIYGAT